MNFTMKQTKNHGKILTLHTERNPTQCFKKLNLITLALNQKVQKVQNREPRPNGQYPKKVHLNLPLTSLNWISDIYAKTWMRLTDSQEKLWKKPRHPHLQSSSVYFKSLTSIKQQLSFFFLKSLLCKPIVLVITTSRQACHVLRHLPFQKRCDYIPLILPQW